MNESIRDVLRNCLLEDSSKAKVGFEWDAPEGKKKIVKIQKHPSTGKDVMFISTEGKPSMEILPTDELDWELKKAKSNLASRQKAQSSKDKEAQDKAKFESWYGFTDGMAGSKKSRVIKILGKQVSLNRSFDLRGNHIRTLVLDKGYTVEKSQLKSVKGKILSSARGSFFTEKDLTKIGMEFAEFLQNKKAN